MKTKRKTAPRPMLAQVISLEAYRNARCVPAPASLEPETLTTPYYRWLALAGAVWTFWWR